MELTNNRLQPPAELQSNNHGVLLRAKTDADVAIAWLTRYEKSPHTFRSYQREVNRLFGWMKPRGLTLHSLVMEDANDFLNWLAHPPAELVGKKVRRGHGEWLPFNKPLSDKSVRHSQTVLITFYRFLNDAQYLNGNPFSLVQRVEVTETTMERYMEQELWQKLTGFLQVELRSMPGVSSFHADRCAWLFALLYYTGARLNEIASARMGNIILRDGRWWFKVLGKRNKEGMIPVPDMMLSALTHYRVGLKLPMYPVPDEKTPLVGRARGDAEQTLSGQAIHLIVKQTLSLFAGHLERQGELHRAQEVKEMSAHWFRHTSATHQLAAGMSLLQVNKNLRHAKLETTKIYSHVESNERHDAMKEFGKPR